jgi:site-specific recombinase XerD
MSDISLGIWVRRFLLEHLVGERNLSPHTRMSYRDTLVLLLPHAAAAARKSVDRLAVDDLSASRVRRFLLDLEQSRGCSVSTRNLRLAAIHSLAIFIARRSPEHVAWCGEIRGIPFKKGTQAVVEYLEQSEVKALLRGPNRLTAQGRRDYALLLFLYNTGARAGEAARLTVGDLDLSSLAVRLFGKGNKERRCPLWKLTARILTTLVAGRAPETPVFLNRRRQPLTRFGVYAAVKRNAAKACRTSPTIEKRCVHPHTLRHTTAVHLLRSGVDINTISSWLGHVSLNTTNIYTKVDLATKAKALARCTIRGEPGGRMPQLTGRGMMAFLRSL